MKDSRRIAASRVIIEGKLYRTHVVELDSDDNVIRHYDLSEELPSTEWHNEISIGKGKVKVIHT